MLLRNIRRSTTLKDVRKAFAQVDKGSQIAWVGDSLTGGMLYEFEEGITPYFLDEEHLNADSNDYWKVVQIDEICQPIERREAEKQIDKNLSDNIVDGLVDHIQSLAQQTKLGADEISQLVMQHISGNGPKESQFAAEESKPSTYTPHPRIPTPNLHAILRYSLPKS